MEEVKQQLAEGSPVAGIELIVQELIPIVNLEDVEKSILDLAMQKILLVSHLREVIKQPECHINGMSWSMYTIDNTTVLRLTCDEISQVPPVTINVTLDNREQNVKIAVEIHAQKYIKQKIQ